MPPVSRRLVKPEVKEKIWDILIHAIGKISNKHDIVPFVSDLLYPTERIMIAKRLAIAFLLLRDEYEQREISNVLKVSTNTVARVNYVLKTQGEGYRNVLRKMLKEESIMKILKELLNNFPRVPTKGTEWGLW